MSYTPEQMAALLEKLPKEIDKAKVNAVRRGIRRARTVAMKDLRSHGVGAALFGKKAKGARLVVKVNNPKMAANGTVTGGLELKGLAAMTEEGGHTKAHTIRPPSGGVLVLKLGGGRVAFTRKAVRHPGSRIPRRPFAKPAIEHELDRIKADLEHTAQDAINKLFR